MNTKLVQLDSAYIPLINGGKIMVDLKHYHKLIQYNWRINSNKRAITRWENESFPCLGREIMELAGHNINGMYVKYKNKDILDNRESNLMLCTQQEIVASSGLRKNNTSGYKGVCWFKTRNKWYARITVNGRGKNLGYFDRKEDAAKAYNAAAIKYFGEFANLNKID